MSFKKVTISKAILTIILCLFAWINWFIGAINNEKKIVELPKLISESITCHTHAATNSAKFIVFITDKPMAEGLLTELCNMPAINRQYGSVEIHWSHNEQEISQYVGKGLADLALVKDNVMQAFATQVTHGYKVIAQYQDYAAYLFSLKEKPQLSKQYLWGKRLGLLDYPSSRSGHIIPKGLLIELGMTDDNLQITYVKSHEALRQLLASGEVDIISTFWQEQDQERFSKNYITAIETKVSGSKWYLKMLTDNTDLVCDLQKSLSQLAKDMHSQYYSQLLLSSSMCQRNADILENEQNEK